jgi:hypothetical protein
MGKLARPTAWSVGRLYDALGAADSACLSDSTLVVYWRKGYLAQDPAEYRSKACRDGGRLDIHPETDTWP